MSTTRAIKQHIPADAKTGYATPDKPAAGEFANARIAIVATRWNVEIVDALVTGARAALKAWGVAGKHVAFFRATGAYEIPLVAKLLLAGSFAGVVALGAEHGSTACGGRGCQ